MTGVRLDWESKPLSWIGTSLKILDLNFGSEYNFFKNIFFENISRSSSDWWVSLLNSNSNLQTLKLSYVKSKGSSTRLVLPNLISLDLNSMNLEGHGIFFDSDLPKLESLKLDLCNLLEDENLIQEVQSFEHSFFLPILQSSQSTLQSLRIKGELDSNAAFFQKERYRFTRLQTLYLYGTTTIVVDLLSHSQFPRLTNFRTEWTSVSPQATLKILASASLSLEKFGEFLNPRLFGSATEFHDSHRSTLSSFPKLKSLTFTPATAFTKDLFLHATFGEVKTLRFFLGESSHRFPFQELAWDDLLCLLRSNASTLKFMWVDGFGLKDDNNLHGNQSEDLDLEFSFPELERMMIKSRSNLQIQRILQHSTYRKLSDLEINVHTPISSKFQSELLNLMLRCSATLRTVHIRGESSFGGSGNASIMGSHLEKEEMVSYGKSIEFTLLRELFISGGAALGFLSELSTCSFPELHRVVVKSGIPVKNGDYLPLMDSVLKKIVEQSPKLRDLRVTDLKGSPIRAYNIRADPDTIDQAEN